MIKICFKNEKQLSPKEEKKSAGKSNVTTPKKAANRPGLKQSKILRGKESSSTEEDVISLKYTIDYPRVELHPFDTRKLTIYFADTKVNA